MKTMHERTKATIKMQRRWAHEFEHCVYVGCHGSPVGCHVYPKGSSPQYSAMLQNGVGLCSKHHTIFDNQGRPFQKIIWLREFVDPEFRGLINDRLDALEIIVEEYIKANRRKHEESK